MNSTLGIIRVAQKYAAYRKIALTTLGKIAANDGKFFIALMAGRTCTVRKMDSILQWFSDHWPADLDWPAGIPRPTPHPDQESAA